MKKWYKSRSLWLGVLTVLAAGADTLATGGGWRQVVVALIGAAIIVLRTYTDKALEA